MLRDKFAMAAMQGLLSDRYNLASSYPEETAQKAYRQADAMMKERANWYFSGDPGTPGKSTGVPDEWQPNWSQAPETATEWLMTEDGRFKWVLLEHGEKWYTKAPSFDYQGDWRESLRKRPTE